MGEEQRKEVGQEFAAEKTECLTETGQTAEDALLSDAAEKAIEREPQPVKKKVSRDKKLGILAAVVVVLAALVIGLCIYNKPENRLARQLNLGERYLEEQNYAEAVLAFEKAIQIDERCMAAYVNGIEAYRHLDEPENLLAFYEKALEAARSLEGENLTADMDAFVSIYLAAADVYTEREAVLVLLEEGYEKSGQDSRVRDSLVSVYLERAEERTSNGAYEDSLQDYDRLLELDGQNGKVLESLSKSLKSYLDSLLEEGNFDRVRELAEKYALALPDFDFELYLDEIDRRELEELRSQLVLSFTPEDVTLFGYRLTEDHFDDIVYLLDLKKENGATDGNGVPIDSWWRYGSPVTANIFPDGSKVIWKDSKNAADNLYSVEPEGENAEYIQYLIDTDKLTWLQNHFPGSYNLPLISYLGEKYEDWYCTVPAGLIKETGEYAYEVYENGTKKETWIVEEPVKVSFVEVDYGDSGIGPEWDWESRECYLDYGSFRIAVDVDINGLIIRMSYFYTYEQ